MAEATGGTAEGQEGGAGHTTGREDHR
ncbi:expressed unknown protein [Ectocarpus siliculosus]|uniref:Uncharacterized protein n=1 Tax=Ectocarpus siliculosus TaxID=2880 RepID=D7FPC6_ECTSI|nr:expressed unknown protein [Ectocarpus siliculosus]|eukprot:CBJ30385.1 expressed unknown protein [Ectocarpus siliculosus]